MASGEKGMVVGRVTLGNSKNGDSLAAMLARLAVENETTTLEIERGATSGQWEATLRLWDAGGILIGEHTGKGLSVTRALERLEEVVNGRE